MSLPVTGVQVDFQQAPHESGVSVVTGFTKQVVISFGTKTGYTDTLANLLVEDMRGCGRVVLESISATLVTSAADQFFKFGIAEEGSSASIDHTCMMPGGVNIRSNAYNYGTQLSFPIIPRGTVSRQIRPQSSDLPMMKIMVAKSAEASLVLTLNISIIGPQVTYRNL